VRDIEKYISVEIRQTLSFGQCNATGVPCIPAAFWQ